MKSKEIKLTGKDALYNKMVKDRLIIKVTTKYVYISTLIDEAGNSWRISKQKFLELIK